MLEIFINIFIDASMFVGTAIFRLLPKSFRREVDPDSTLGQVLGLVLGITLVIGVAIVISNLK